MEEEINEIMRILGIFNEYYKKSEADCFLGRKAVSKLSVQDPSYANNVRVFSNAIRRMEKLDEWIRKIEGVTRGYFEECRIAGENIRKGRFVAYDRADVTIRISGQPERGVVPQGKAIQAKSTITDAPSAVNNMIKKGLNQLTGETGEIPETWERPVVSMSIKSSGNCWPYISRQERVISLQDYVRVACAAMTKNATSYLLNRAGLSRTYVLSLTDVGNKSLNWEYMNQSRLCCNGRSVKFVTVKIIYPQKSYYIVYGGTKCRIIKVTFFVYRAGVGIITMWHRALLEKWNGDQGLIYNKL